MPPETIRKPSSASPPASAAGVAHDLGGVLPEVRLRGQVERDRLRRDHVHQRAALQTREDRLVDRRRVLLAAEDRAGPRAPQGLVRREGDDVGVRNRARVRTTGDQAGDVRGVDDEEGIDLVGDRTERGEVDGPGVGGGPGDDRLGALSLGEVADHVIVQGLALVIDAIGDEVVDAAAEVDRGAVGQVPALIQTHPHELVAGREQGEVHRHVGVRPRVRLDVGVLGAEQRTRAVAGQLLGLVHDEVAAVVPLPGVALRVLVREHGALRGHAPRAR